MMRTLFAAILYPLLIILFTSCGDAVKDDFPKRQFTGYFNLNYPEYSKEVFTARRDMNGSLVGSNGIVAYNAGENYYVFDLMCPYEKKMSCSLRISEDDPSIAECECCGSRFLIASPTGDLIEGPAGRGLQKYNARITPGRILVVTSY